MTDLMICQICRSSRLFAFRSASIFPTSLQSEFPNHPFLPFVENVFAFHHAPKSQELPTSDGEFVKKRNSMFWFDCREHRFIKWIELLVAAPTCARVKNCVLSFAVNVRVTRIDSAEISQQRDESPVSLINSVPYAVNFINFIPWKNVADAGVC